MYLQQNKLQHINSIAHEGKIVVFGTDADGKIWYTVKQDGFEDSYLNTPAEQRKGWEEWKELEFPDEDPDKSVVEKETAELTYKDEPTKFILNSRYKTKEESAVAPVQVISGLDHIYVFRQSTSNTLLVDRFVLDGMTNKLNRKLEVRFKRSKQKHQPTKNMNKGANGLVNIDSLDFRDANGNDFYEPTTELCLVNNLKQGWFSVVLVPTIENDVYRWHIFAYNSETEKVELTTIRASKEGLFDVKDYTVFDQGNDELVPRIIPGIIQRTLEIKGVTVTNGLAATKYDLQQEQETQSGEKQLIKTATRLMLAIPTDKGTAAFSFAIAGDGTLAQIDKTPKIHPLRSTQREILLPLNTLDAIKEIGDSTLPPEGIITGLAKVTKKEKEDAEDLVKISTQGAGELKDNDLVKIKGTSNYQGLYRVKKVDKDTFEIDLPPKKGDQHTSNELGYWEKEEQEEGGLIFNGMITAYKKTADGKLQVDCPGHQLKDNDEVQITGTDVYNNTYPVKKIDDTHFIIERKWATAEAIDIKTQVSQKRRGVVFDGKKDHISLPNMNHDFSRGFTVEAWVWYDSFENNSKLIDLANSPNDGRICFGNHGTTNTLGLYISPGTAKEQKELTAPRVLETGNWLHLAATIDKDGNAKLYKNGEQIQTGKISLPKTCKRTKNYIGKSNLSEEGYFNGKISDLRIWKTARTAEEIQNNMHLPLTGKEVGLVSYWRLGGISEGKVIDFSVNGNDGTVHGDAYISARTLNRKLKGGNDAIEYSNSELFAVTERASYKESFEFKVEFKDKSQTAVNLAYLNNADGKGIGKKIFTFAYWGKTSRSAEKIKTIDGNAVTNNKFEDLGNGWYRASCNVTIPDGVSLLRSFKIADVNGDWEFLEIRKHCIRLVSDSISEAKYTDEVTLETLADEQTTLAATLEQLELKEVQELKLLKEKRELETKITAYDNQEQTKIKIETLDAQIQTIKKEERDLSEKLNGEKSDRDRTNHYYKLEDQNSCKVLTLKQEWTTLIISSDENSPNQLWQFIPASDGYFKIKGKPSPLVLDVGGGRVDNGARVMTFKDGNGDNQLWKLEPTSDGFFKIKSKQSGKVLDVAGSDTKDGAELSIFDNSPVKNQIWKLVPTSNEYPNNKIPDAFTKLQNKQKELSEQEKQKASLEQGLKANADEKKKWDDRHAKLIAEITAIQTEINTLNHTFLEGVTKTQQKPQSMPQIAQDDKGLITQGALLGFVSPASRLNAIETCEGNVQLSYFDTQRRMRQTLYDATADSSKNATFERWIPDAQRACLNLDKDNSVVKLNKPVSLSRDWTIEAWFVYPLPPVSWLNTLAQGQNGYCNIAVMSDQELAIFLPIGNSFSYYNSGFNMKLLSQGWHHLTAVGRGDTTLFYIDGKKVGDTKAKTLADAKESLNQITKEADAKKKDVAALKAALEKNVAALKAAEEKDVAALKAALAKNVAALKAAEERDKELDAALKAAEKKVEDIKNATLKVNSPIDAIGNSKNGGEQFGKLAEVRIWGVALSDEEIAVNSKTLLSGNEPGLLAYYPMNEATGEEVRDHSWKEHDGEKHHGTVSGASWWGCTAPIGNLGNTVMQFDGVKDHHISLPEMNHDFSGGFTVEAWVWYDNFKFWTRIIDFGKGAGIDNILLANEQNSNNLCLHFYQGGEKQEIKADSALETGKWMHLAATVDTSGNAKLYKDGQQIQLGKLTLPKNLKPTKNYIGKSNWAHDEYFNGKISDLRIWKVARTQAEIQANMSKRLSGKEPNLVAYYPLNEIKPEGKPEGKPEEKVFDLVDKKDGTVHGAITVDSNTLPISRDAIVCNEYSSVTVGKDGKQAIMRRFYASVATNGVTLLPDKRIEALELKWIGNGQFAPTLYGYIEGPPPVPSENLTLEDDYNGATSVELTMSEDVKFSWKRSDDAGWGMKFDGFIGLDTEGHAGLGATAKVAEVRAGGKGNLDFSYQFLNESNITASSSLSATNKLELRGTPEETAKFSHLGKRFIPKNIGYALVVSALADVYVIRLARTGKMVGQQVKPVDGIPPDVNTITFLINPAYTMNGSLDGLTGSRATSDRFFKHVPEMRSQYGSLYPASYYRLQEAYDLKRQIEAEDKRREAYFYNFDARSRHESSMKSAVLFSGDKPTTVGLQRGEDQPDTQDAGEEKEKKAAQQKLEKDKVEAAAKTKQQETTAQQKLAEIRSQIDDIEKQAQATESLAGWQKWMEAILIRAGKRNIVNTYVWDADGGLRTEAQSFANTVEQTIGGSFNLNAGLGSEGKFGILGAKVELTAQHAVNLTETMSKTKDRSEGFELKVDLSKVESKGITDYNDKPILPGEKVDRYRFMSFYLEGSTNNFQDFFNYVVDPEWLASNSEEARALRQAQAGKPNKTWRVLHRVTYVERPALMGFGRDVRKLRAAQESDKLADVLSKVKELEDKNQKLEKKIDEILNWVKSQQR